MQEYTEKVGLMGGTFDPIHIGHLLLAEIAGDYFSLDKVLFIPSGNSYMKNKVSDKEIRTALTAAAITDNPLFELSSIETERDGDTYSYETLLTLNSIHPKTQYFFIIGADSLFTIERWKNPELLFENCVIAAAARKGYRTKDLKEKITYLNQNFGADIRLFLSSRVDVSSTEIRCRIKKGQSVRYMLPEKVTEYIIQHNLYL